MGLLRHVTTVAGAPTLRAEGARPSGYGDPFWYSDAFMLPLLASGISMTPELALTLSHVHAAVSTISDDIGMMSCQVFAGADGGERRRVSFGEPGIGSLAYQLRWQPNPFQTATDFWRTLVWQYLLRPNAYAEIVTQPGRPDIIEALVPRHPDRVEQQVLPAGRLRFKLTEPGAAARYLTQDEMFVVRNTSTDGLNALSRVHYGAKALASTSVLQDFTLNYFSRGVTGAVVATHKGSEDLTPDQKSDLHASMQRYWTGTKNAGGILLVEADIDVKAIGVDPKNAELLGLKNLGGRDVARLFRVPAYKLNMEDGGKPPESGVDTEYLARLQTILVKLEQAIYTQLILSERFHAKFNMDVLQRGDRLRRMQAHEVGIRARVIRPSEAREVEDLKPDAELDRLSAMDYRPGSPAGATPGSSMSPGAAAAAAGVNVRTVLAFHDAAQRVLRREQVAVEKLAKRHADDPAGWQRELATFYEDHARFVGETLRLPDACAQAYATAHATALADYGMPVMTDGWVRESVEELTLLAVDPPRHAAA